ncbi:MAG: DUF4250 domain-containing protein [Verrucomicrobiales bacterium]
MNLSSYRTMDPALLVGLVNTALRNDCEDIEDLARTHDLDHEILERRLKEHGYRYVAAINQFRPIAGEPG